MRAHSETDLGTTLLAIDPPPAAGASYLLIRFAHWLERHTHVHTRS
jgi:hypothetical protein